MNRGYTLVEMIVVLGILAVLMSLASINLIGVQRKSYLDKSLEILLSDMKHQQAKAMHQQGLDEHTFGIYFGESEYVLFQGNAYDAQDPTNFTVPLEGELIFSNVTFANSELIFESGSGEIRDFIEGNSTIIIFESTNSVEITLNKFGVVANLVTQ